MSTLKSIREIELKGKRVFLRLDFNVPLTEPDSNGVRKITDDSRIIEALPTILFAIEKGAKLILASHLGRPDGRANPDYSLEPVANHLASILKTDVTLADDCVGDGISVMTKSLKEGQILLLENLRFHAGEEANDPEFVRGLSELCDVYINDAFGTAHREHASTYGLPQVSLQKGMGFLIEREIKFLEPLIKNPAKPFLAVLGGSKVTDKIKTIEELMRNVDGIAIGGAMAHAFWKVEGIPIPADAKQPKQADVDAAKAILAKAKLRGTQVLLPVDTNLGFDIGPKSIEEFKTFLNRAKTVFWNGPLGWFEKPDYAVGTFEVARHLAGLPCLKVVGGGDTVSAIKLSGVAEKFDHLSTGGGAVLEYIEEGTLPGIEVLRVYPKQTKQSAHLE